MKLDYWQCDMCEKEFADHIITEIGFAIGTQHDPVDGHSSDIFAYADLCLKCSRRLLNDLLRKLDTAARKELADKYKAKK